MQEDNGKLARRLRLAYLILCLASMVWAVWEMVPEHQRTAWRLKALRSCALVTSRLGRRTGVASMGRELATGEQVYAVPYRLSLWRDALERAYDRTRGAL